MRYREFLGVRLLAVIAIVPAMLFVALALEGSAWWLVLALSWPILALGVVGYLNRDN